MIIQAQAPRDATFSAYTLHYGRGLLISTDALALALALTPVLRLPPLDPLDPLPILGNDDDRACSPSVMCSSNHVFLHQGKHEFCVTLSHLMVQLAHLVGGRVVFLYRTVHARGFCRGGVYTDRAFQQRSCQRNTRKCSALSHAIEM
jgi:hypothetical protein